MYWYLKMMRTGSPFVCDKKGQYKLKFLVTKKGGEIEKQWVYSATKRKVSEKQSVLTSYHTEGKGEF